MFHNIREAWEHALSGASDVRELIPEFYLPPGDFLLNEKQLDLGVRDSGEKLDHVVLPPWARDAREFTAKLREALESDYASSRIHFWIDLVFGCKQRGEAAVQADNLFNYITYEGAVDMETINDPIKQSSLKVQIMEFGQTPTQLLTLPHPSRLDTSHNPPPTSANSTTSPSPSPPLAECDTHIHWEGLALMELQFNCKIHKDSITSIFTLPKENAIVSVSKDHSLRMFSLTSQQQIRCAMLSSLTLSSCLLMPNQDTIVVGSWDDCVYFYSIEYANVLHKMKAHDNSVTSLAWRMNTLVTGSSDTSVKVIAATESAIESPRYHTVLWYSI